MAANRRSSRKRKQTTRFEQVHLMAADKIRKCREKKRRKNMKRLSDQKLWEKKKVKSKKMQKK